MILLIIFVLFGSVTLLNNLEIFIKQYYNPKRIAIYTKQQLKNIKLTNTLVYRFLIILTSNWFLILSFDAFLYCLSIGLLVINIIQIKKFSLTRRSLSLYVASFTIVIALCVSAYLLNIKALWLLLFIVLNIPFLIIVLSNTLLIPYEWIFQTIYISKAKKKLKENTKLKIIGVTGSYGKTSFKNYLYALLSERYNVIKTPGSINTKMGICKFINNSLSPYDDILIVEYGVDEIKGMDKLLKLVKPNIAIITSIGEMHLTTFKSIKNIKKEKLKLAYNSLDKVVFYNEDSILSSSDFINIKSNPYSLKEVENIKIDINGTSCTYKGQRIHVNLYGNHHLLNLLGAIEVSKYFLLSNNQIQAGLNKISPVKHRLSLEKRGKFYVLDDSYNGNKQGILEAIKVLKSFEGKKAIITPGVIEIGDKYNKTNYEIGQNLIGIDLIYLIGDENHPMYKGYLNKGGNKNSVHFCDSFIISYHHLLKENINFLLIANDTPKDYLR